jgi:cytochrome c553
MQSIVLRLWLVLAIMMLSTNAFASLNDVEAGRKIYVEGILPSGLPLKGVREGEEFSGKQAACVACHRPSGMGSVEGDIQVPPITGNYLYRTGNSLQATMDPRSGKRFNIAHDPYTDAAVNKAVTQGINIGGHEMSVLMPRYTLSSEEMRLLTVYLKQLSQQYSPGVTKDEIHFATVITPDADPERRRILLRVLERGITQKNGSTMLGGKRSGRRHMVTAAELVLGTERKWVLDVWNLQGAPETWQKQLQEFNQKEPVFALLSGLSGTTWQPVHAFCEQNKIPCWLPSVDLPDDSLENNYSLYFQRGVMLEAEVLAKYLEDEPTKMPQRVVQIFRDDALGLGASSALSNAMKTSGAIVENRAFKGDLPSLRKALEGLNSQDAVMLWMNGTDLSLLNAIPVPKANFFLSGRMSGGEKLVLADQWKMNAKMIYPYELPEKRQINLNYFHSWMRFNQIPIEDEPLQAEAYFALDFMSDTMTEMLDNVYRDYLLERAESMLSRSETSKSEQRDRVRQVMRWSTRVPRIKKPDTVEASDQKEEPVQTVAKSTTIYPRMSLGVAQRFTSKGAYIVKFDDSIKNKIVPQSDWIVP